MTNTLPKRLAEIPVTSLGRPFDDTLSRCLTSEHLAIAPSFSFCQGSLGDNLGYFRESGLIANDLAFDVVDDVSFNAFATKAQGHDVVVIHSGVPVCLAAIFYKLLSIRTLFPWVGQPENEREKVDPLPGLPDSFNNDAAMFLGMIVNQADRDMFLRHLSNEDVKSRADYEPWRLNRAVQCPVEVVGISPIDKERKAFVNILLRWSLAFIMYHEIGHILHGHVDYLGQESGSLFYTEVGLDLEAAVSQDQEYQADSFAALVTFLPLLTYSETLYPEVFDRDRTRFVYTWGFVLAVLFTVLWLLEPADIPSELRTHPHPYQRLGTAFMGALGRAHIAGLDSKPEHFAVAMDALNDLYAHIGQVLPGYVGFFNKDTPVEISISLEEAKGRYKNVGKWDHLDRLRTLTKNQGLFQLHYRV